MRSRVLVRPVLSAVFLLNLLSGGVFCGWGGIEAAAVADEPEIEASLSAEEIFIGESVTLQVEIRHSKNPGAPDMGPLKEQFDVESLGDQSRDQSSTFIINGRVSQQSVLSHVYLYRLTPRAAGNLEIPPIQGTADGQSLTTTALTLRVLDAEVQDLVIAEVRSDTQRVYPTQPFEITLKILVRPLPGDEAGSPLMPLRRQPPRLQINWLDEPEGLGSDERSAWLQPLLAENGIGFTLNDVTTRSSSIFSGPQLAVFDLYKGREVRNGLDGVPVSYFVFELTRKFVPSRSGTFTFGPAIVKGTFVSGVEGDQYTAKRLVAMAPAAMIEVRDVPSPRPTTYCGGIGEYRIAASAGPTKLRVGDPLTLTLVLERGKASGSLELLSAPDLMSMPQLASDFDVIDRNPTGRIEGDSKKFSYALRPKRPGASIPSLTVTTFDPVSEKFTDTTTEAIPLEVTEASSVSSSDLVGAVAQTETSEIRTSAEGIFQNVTSLSELYDQRVSIPVSVSLAAIAWGLAGIGVLGVNTYRRRSTDTVWQRRQQARRTARQRLADARSALNGGQIQESLSLLRLGIAGLIADLCNKVTEGLTATDVSAILAKASVPSDDRIQTQKLLETIESAQYGAGQSADVSGMLETATALIERIGPYLERGA